MTGRDPEQIGIDPMQEAINELHAKAEGRRPLTDGVEMIRQITPEQISKTFKLPAKMSEAIYRLPRTESALGLAEAMVQAANNAVHNLARELDLPLYTEGETMTVEATLDSSDVESTAAGPVDEDPLNDLRSLVRVIADVARDKTPNPQGQLDVIGVLAPDAVDLATRIFASRGRRTVTADAVAEDVVRPIDQAFMDLHELAYALMDLTADRTRKRRTVLADIEEIAAMAIEIKNAGANQAAYDMGAGIASGLVSAFKPKDQRILDTLCTLYGYVEEIDELADGPVITPKSARRALQSLSGDMKTLVNLLLGELHDEREQ